MQKLEIWDWFENSGVWLIESIPLDCVFVELVDFFYAWEEMG